MITLQFVCDTAISSKIIAWFGAGNFSHVDVVMPDGQLLGARSDAIGGKPPGVQIRPAGYDNFALKVQFTLPASQTEVADCYAFLMKQIGKPYDFTAIAGFIAGRDWRQQDSWICSELAAAALEAAHILPALYVPTNKITPDALALAVSAAGAVAHAIP